MASEPDVYEIVSRLAGKLKIKTPAIEFSEKGYMGFTVPAFFMDGKLAIRPGLAEELSPRQLEVCIAYALSGQHWTKRIAKIISLASTVGALAIAALFIAAFEMKRREFVAPFWLVTCGVLFGIVALSVVSSLRQASATMMEVYDLTRDPDTMREHFMNAGYQLRKGSPIKPNEKWLRKRVADLDLVVKTRR